MLEYHYICYYVCDCGFFYSKDGEEYYIDTKTGLLTDEQHGGSGSGGAETQFLYDEKKSLYGFYAIGDFPPEFEMWSGNDFLEKGWYADRLNAFIKIDSDRVKANDHGDPWTNYDLS